MNLELLKSLIVITEAKAPPAAPPKIAKDVELEPAPKEPKGGDAGDTSFTPEKTAFFFRPKFDVYGNLEQTEDQELRRETKRVYTMFGREHERGVVYGITSGSEREFKRIARMLDISTDGEVTLERVKRAGFTAAGRIGAKRLMKRGDYVVSLVGPSDDQTTITFYTAKPVSKVTESQDDLFDFEGADHKKIMIDLEAEADRLIASQASHDEMTDFLNNLKYALSHESIPDSFIHEIGNVNQRIVKKFKAAGFVRA